MANPTPAEVPVGVKMAVFCASNTKATPFIHEAINSML
jgi:hypothetical protein